MDQADQRRHRQDGDAQPDAGDPQQRYAGEEAGERIVAARRGVRRIHERVPAVVAASAQERAVAG